MAKTALASKTQKSAVVLNMTALFSFDFHVPIFYLLVPINFYKNQE